MEEFPDIIKFIWQPSVVFVLCYMFKAMTLVTLSIAVVIWKCVRNIPVDLFKLLSKLVDFRIKKQI